jgi:porphobilinogen synthase
MCVFLKGDLMLIKRPRRNRKTLAIRSLLAETTLLPSDFVLPVFITAEQEKKSLVNMPGVFAWPIEKLLKEAEIWHAKGILAIALFPIIPHEYKDINATYALSEKGLILQALQKLKKEIPSLCVITDIALDPFTSHGHDGILNEQKEVVNDKTVSILTQMALLHAQFGADLVAPSDMMDGRIRAIRNVLDDHLFHQVGILAYTAKYASCLYSPFRDAVGSRLQHGDKKSYQMNPANSREAIRQALLDEEQGADILMVKPALYYLDIITKMKEKITLPICAYHVSGEYAMIMAAEEKGILQAKETFQEAMLSIKRAGADFIFSYAVPLLFP